MEIEHIAFNVENPDEVAAWYVSHLGFRIARCLQEPPFTHFIADDNGCMVEIYRNPPDAVPNYQQMNPLQLHLALVSQDPTSDRDRLIAAGATLHEELQLQDGTRLVMLRDPWGFPVQLCKRGIPF